MTHKDNGKESDPQAGHKMSDIQASHARHAGHSVAMFRGKFWLSLALTMPVAFWSTDIQHWLGYTAPTFPRSQFIPPILGPVVFVYGGLVFIRGARGELADHKPGMIAAAVMMPWLASRKRKLAVVTSSAVLKADAAESALCGYMAWIALTGLVVNAIWNKPWADPVAALALTPLILRETWEAVHSPNLAHTSC